MSDQQPPPHKVGIEWTSQLRDGIETHLSDVDAVEIIAENFFYDRRRDELERICDLGKPILLHCVELSLGSADGFKRAHFERVMEIARLTDPANLSDHLAWCEHGGVETMQPAILPFTRDAAEAVIRNVDEIQQRTGIPFLIENEANRFQFPVQDYSEPDFINEILARTGCGLLLDVANLYCNQINFGVDSIDWLSSIDLERVGVVHIAGGRVDDLGMRIDSHDDDVPEQVWDLYRWVMTRSQPQWTILERTGSLPRFERIAEEMAFAREIVGQCVAGTSQRIDPMHHGGTHEFL